MMATAGPYVCDSFQAFISPHFCPVCSTNLSLITRERSAAAPAGVPTPGPRTEIERASEVGEAIEWFHTDFSTALT
jgi:hypothetical protein